MPKPSVWLAAPRAVGQGAVVDLVPCETAFSRPPSHLRMEGAGKGEGLDRRQGEALHGPTTAPAGPPWRWRAGRARAADGHNPCCPYRGFAVSAYFASVLSKYQARLV